MQPTRASLTRFNRIRHTLTVISALRRVRQPFTTAQGLKQSLELLLQLGRTTGLDRTGLAPLQRMVEDEEAFQVVWAIVQYLGGLVCQEHGTAETLTLTARDGSQTSVPTAAFFRWLPLVVQVMSLLRQIRA